ncbi:MAG: hypothetical protein C4310_10255, partial [Chloroflexota bacterium]
MNPSPPLIGEGKGERSTCPQHLNMLAGVILTYNEAAHIAACIDSLRWADEVVVFDSFSTDGTVELARQAGAR